MYSECSQLKIFFSHFAETCSLFKEYSRRVIYLALKHLDSHGNLKNAEATRILCAWCWSLILYSLLLFCVLALSKSKYF